MRDEEASEGNHASFELSLTVAGAIQVEARAVHPLVVEFLQTDLTGLVGLLPALQRMLSGPGQEESELCGNAFSVRVGAEEVTLRSLWKDASVSLPVDAFSAILRRYEAEVRRLRPARGG